MKGNKTIGRREFLKVLAAGIATAIGLRTKLNGQASGGSAGSHKWVMVIDQDKCTGCGYCTLACQAHNDAPPQIQWNRVIKAGKLGERDIYLSRPCMHLRTRALRQRLPGKSQLQTR